MNTKLNNNNNNNMALKLIKRVTFTNPNNPMLVHIFNLLIHNKSITSFKSNTNTKNNQESSKEYNICSYLKFSTPKTL